MKDVILKETPVYNQGFVFRYSAIKCAFIRFILWPLNRFIPDYKYCYEVLGESPEKIISFYEEEMPKMHWNHHVRRKNYNVNGKTHIIAEFINKKNKIKCIVIVFQPSDSAASDIALDKTVVSLRFWKVI